MAPTRPTARLLRTYIESFEAAIAILADADGDHYSAAYEFGLTALWLQQLGDAQLSDAITDIEKARREIVSDGH